VSVYELPKLFDQWLSFLHTCLGPRETWKGCRAILKSARVLCRAPEWMLKLIFGKKLHIFRISPAYQEFYKVFLRFHTLRVFRIFLLFNSGVSNRENLKGPIQIIPIIKKISKYEKVTGWDFECSPDKTSKNSM
jgi:hypothetical protein